MKNKNILYHAALFLAALIWGSSFFVKKNVVGVFPPNILLCVRFSIGFIILALVFAKRLKKTTWAYVAQGAALGAILYIAYFFQTTGIMSTTPGKNAFLTATYCVIVPFLYWLVDKSRPDKYNLAAAFMCLIGMGCVSLNGDLSLNTGDALTMVSGVFYALHMVCVAKFTKTKDPILLTIFQFGFAALCCIIVALPTETMRVSDITPDSVFGLLYLAIFATSLGLLLQNVGQKKVHPATASIILSLEAVFGALFSVIFYGETIYPKEIIGFVLIFASVIVSETKLSFLRKSDQIQANQ